MNNLLEFPWVKTVSYEVQSAVFLRYSLWLTVPEEGEISWTIAHFKKIVRHCKGQKNAPVECAGTMQDKLASWSRTTYIIYN